MEENKLRVIIDDDKIRKKYTEYREYGEKIVCEITVN